MPKPDQLSKPQFPGMDPTFQQHYQQLIDTVNTLSGYNGEIELSDHLNLGFKRIKNVGVPVDPSDALSSGVAAGKYSAAVLRPQLESGSSQPFRSYRQMNNQTQREATSSWLNDLMSSPPNANTVFPTLTNVGSNVQVSIPASIFTFADGSQVKIQGRVDLLSRPAQYAITSLSVASGLVTVNCAASGLIAGEVATIVPGTNSTFAGTFQLTSSTGGGSVLQYQDPSASGTDTSGFVEVNGVYYYTLKKRSQTLVLRGPFTIDSCQNRLQVCFDGSQIVAVIVVTNSGAQVQLSGGGGTPITGASPGAGAFF